MFNAPFAVHFIFATPEGACICLYAGPHGDGSEFAGTVQKYFLGFF